jgi:mono/diheme cytochrome c family protein
MNSVAYTIALIALAGPTLAAPAVDYFRDIKPILTTTCVKCHGADQQKGGLRLDTTAAALKGGEKGPAIKPGKSAESLLIQVVEGTHADIARMPYKKSPLSDAQIALLKAWIAQGAKAPADEKPAAPRHWAFVPPTRPPVPKLRNPQPATRNPIDNFILARLEKEGIRPSPEADRYTLIRRLSLDLLGLPPTIQEVDAFVNDKSPNAYERLVERLLSSPHYGERWGRWWLDVARYADSNGYSIDAPREIWKYRDWVIDALNRDLPFDQFATEQLAGDILPNPTLEQKIATGFHRNTQINQEGGIDKEQFRIESIIDRVNTTGAAFLGLTIGCCQCHDHKFDPLTQKEFYGLFAFFNNAEEPDLPLASPDVIAREKDAEGKIAAHIAALPVKDATVWERMLAWERSLTPEQRQAQPEEVRAAFDVQFAKRSDAQKQTTLTAFVESATENKTHQSAIRKIRATKPKIQTTMVLREMAKPRRSYLFIKGDFTRDGGAVEPAVPAILHPLKFDLGSARGPRADFGDSPKSRSGNSISRNVQAESGGPTEFTPERVLPNRLDLARWIVDPANPLTARVTVNRIWQQYFGKGIVETENDFGTQGIPPTHPELLDWLACEFMTPSAFEVQSSAPWSLKHLHRLIVTSATYQQSSKARPDLATVDPNNKLLARQNRLRLDAEVVRDVALAASGLLIDKIGGPSVFPPIPDGVMTLGQIKRDWKVSEGADRYRRGLYTFFFRATPPPALAVFDAPDAFSTCTRRIRSNTPLQALTLLNDQAFFEFAQGLADRVLREGANNAGENLEHAFRICMARKPSPEEKKRLQELVSEELRTAESEESRKQTGAWTTVARVLLNLDETITRE